MTQLLFLSTVYWLNFAILSVFKCIDLLSVTCFYLFLVFFVFPAGHLCYSLLFGRRLYIEETLLAVIKILLAIPVIAIINFIFGINYISNATLLLFSYAYIILFNMRGLKRPVTHEVDMRDLKGSYLFAIIFSALFTAISRNSFKIYSFFSDHITIVPYPSDSSHYYGMISGLVRHVGNFIHGYKIALYSGVNVSAFPSLLEIFESVFIKFSGTDIVLFHSVNFALFLILLFFCASLLPVFKKSVLAKIEFNNPWNSIFLGLIVLALFSYARNNSSLLKHSITALHSFSSWIYVLIAMKIYFSAEALLKKSVNIRPYVMLALLLCFIGFSLHMISAGIFFLSFIVYLLYRQLARRGRIYFVLIWVLAIIGSVIVLAGVFKNYAFIFGELRISISSFYFNSVIFRNYINDLFFLKLIYKSVSAFAFSNTFTANIAGGIYTLFRFTGYLSIILICYLLVSKRRFRHYFALILPAICMALLLVNCLAHCPQRNAAPCISSRPDIAAMYTPYMAPIAIAGSIYALFCFTGYFFVIPVYYFFVSKSRFKFYFVNILSAICIVLLLVNYLISHRPSIIAAYMPNVTLIAVALMMVEIILAGGYFQFQKTGASLKSIVILFLTILVLYLNYSMFAVPHEKLNMDRKLYEVIEYVKKNTPSDSVLLHNLKASPYYAYFSGFAYRDVVMERSAYAYSYVNFKNHDERFADILLFYKKDTGPDLRLKIIDKYSVTHILSSPDCPLDLRGINFKPVFSNSEYTLYEYSR